jgi:hypothetical protein
MVFDVSSSYQRFGTKLLRRPVPPGEEVTIRVTETEPDYSTSHRPVEPPAERSLQLFSYLVTP